MQGMEKVKGYGLYLLLVSIVLIWGLSWPVNKLGLEFIPPFWFAALRLLIGTTAMFFILIVLNKLIIPTKKDLPLILCMGFFQIGFFILFINLALAIEPSGTSAILVYSTPLWVTPMAIFFFKEANRWLKWLGFILGIIGVLIMLNPEEIDWSNPGVLLAMTYLMCASIAMSISILCARYMTWHHTPLELIPWQLLLASIILVLVALKMDPTPTIHLNVTSIACLLYTGILATAFGFFGMSKLSKELPATLTSICFLGVPVSGVMFSVIMLHESVGVYKILAMIFILSGLICVVYGEKSKPSHRSVTKKNRRG